MCPSADDNEKPGVTAQSVANVDIRVGRRVCAIVLPAYAIAAAMIGATITSCRIVTSGNAMCTDSPGLAIARNTTATGMKPVGIATAAPHAAMRAAFHDETARHVDGDRARRVLADLELRRGRTLPVRQRVRRRGDRAKPLERRHVAGRQAHDLQRRGICDGNDRRYRLRDLDRRIALDLAVDDRG